MVWRLLICLLVQATLAFYVPVITPVEYPFGSPVVVKVNSITSTKTAIPYDYYDLPFCRPGGTNPEPQAENFGEILLGNSIKLSPYITYMGINVNCRRVCTVTPTAEEMKRLRKRIEEGYRGHLMVDNLPASEIFSDEVKGFRTLVLGYPLGTPKQPQTNYAPAVPQTQINNHITLTIKYHQPADFAAAQKGFRIVGFHVIASSWKHDEKGCSKFDRKNAGWYPASGNPVTVNDTSIVFSYSVTWIEDPELAWSSRWDPYLSSAETDAKIHWFSIVNSVLIILFLSGVVAMIMMRALRKDFNRYNDEKNADEAQEEAGWKLVHGDVFRTPPRAALLATYIGTGCQLLGMAVITTIFAVLGLLSPANRGALLTVMLLLFILLGSCAGFVSARFCKMFQCQSWENTLMTGTFYPGQVFGVFVFMDLCLWGIHASNAIPFSTMMALLGLWLCVSLPLVFVGAVVGYKRPAIEHPIRVNAAPRNIPKQRWYMRAPFPILMAGILPFGAAFIELFFILSSLWLNRFYYVFGFFGLVLIILIVTCAEITTVMVYFQLCYEDYRWWWRSFFISGSSGIHLFFYSIFYFVTTLQMPKFWSGVIYFGWMLVISYTFAIITGTIGFIASFFFVRYIYSSIKVD